MPKCPICNIKFKQKFFLQKHCMGSDLCVRAEIEEKYIRKWKQEKKLRAPFVYSDKYKAKLQREINRLARMIDNKFGYKCIDCGSDYGKQQDAGHYHSVGSNNSLRYNLHNIHSQKSSCNRFYGGKKKEYYEGLLVRYGADYANYVDVELPIKFKSIKLLELEVVECLKITRKIIRDFDNYNGTSIELRNLFNEKIGVYVV